MRPALLLACAAALSAQDFQQRGYLDLRTVLPAQEPLLIAASNQALRCPPSLPAKK